MEGIESLRCGCNSRFMKLITVREINSTDELGRDTGADTWFTFQCDDCGMIVDINEDELYSKDLEQRPSGLQERKEKSNSGVDK